MAVLRHIALNLLKHQSSGKAGTAAKRKMGWPVGTTICSKSFAHQRLRLHMRLSYRQRRGTFGLLDFPHTGHETIYQNRGRHAQTRQVYRLALLVSDYASPLLV